MRFGQSGLLVMLAAMLSAGLSVPVAAAQEEQAEAAEAKAVVLEEKVADQPEPVPAAPADEITPAEAEAVDPAGSKPLDDPLTCLARTIYWEAKGEGEAGMTAVAAVVMNRLADPAFPKTVCAVVTDGRENATCQFSWWCDGRPDDVEEPEPYAQAVEIARRALNQQIDDPTDGAVNFHLDTVHPDWADEFVRTATIGAHLFYRAPEVTATK
ncbi:cell wall hydrolase [Geminicoccus harenae]|uniref:cell wall hydrolase n=2 Tax=Geminicoccus harenae TaxID=2498453 RepID=UPI00168A754D|nr:cell wall hydrolase [Geminicoccus harenae]